MAHGSIDTARRASPSTIRTDFYREEFIKHQRWLEKQREFYSESAITDAEAALRRILARLEQLCTKDDADIVLSRLLHQLDCITGLSAWSDPSNVH